jgi:hypothetical protein
MTTGKGMDVVLLLRVFFDRPSYQGDDAGDAAFRLGQVDQGLQGQALTDAVEAIGLTMLERTMVNSSSIGRRKDLASVTGHQGRSSSMKPTAWRAGPASGGQMTKSSSQVVSGP